MVVAMPQQQTPPGQMGYPWMGGGMGMYPGGVGPMYPPLHQPLTAQVYLIPPKVTQAPPEVKEAPAPAPAPAALSLAEMAAEKAYQDALARGAKPEAALAGKKCFLASMEEGYSEKDALEGFATAEAAIAAGQSAAAAQAAGLMSAKALHEGYGKPAAKAAGKAAAQMVMQGLAPSAAEAAATAAAKAVKAGKPEPAALIEAAGAGMKQDAISRGSTPASANIASEAVISALMKGLKLDAALTGGKSAEAAIEKGLTKAAALKAAETASEAVAAGKSPLEALAAASAAADKAHAEAEDQGTNIVIHVHDGKVATTPAPVVTTVPVAVKVVPVTIAPAKSSPAAAAAPAAVVPAAPAVATGPMTIGGIKFCPCDKGFCPCSGASSSVVNLVRLNNSQQAAKTQLPRSTQNATKEHAAATPISLAKSTGASPAGKVKATPPTADASSYNVTAVLENAEHVASIVPFVPWGAIEKVGARVQSAFQSHAQKSK